MDKLMLGANLAYVLGTAKTFQNDGTQFAPPLHPPLASRFTEQQAEIFRVPDRNRVTARNFCFLTLIATHY
jgi:hypothetical protein